MKEEFSSNVFYFFDRVCPESFDYVEIREGWVYLKDLIKKSAEKNLWGNSICTVLRAKANPGVIYEALHQ